MHAYTYSFINTFFTLVHTIVEMVDNMRNIIQNTELKQEVTATKLP